MVDPHPGSLYTILGGGLATRLYSSLDLTALQEGETPPWGPIYALNEVELEELRNWLKKMTEMGAVRESKSSCSSPMLFVPKGHGRGLC